MVYITAETPRGQIDQYARLMREIGQTHVRGIAFALNGVGKDAQARINAGLASVIDQPNAFTQRALAVRLIPLSTQTLANVSSDVHVLPAQSAYLKYLLGDGSSVRSPGDVGPADEHIYVPL